MGRRLSTTTIGRTTAALLVAGGPARSVLCACIRRFARTAIAGRHRRRCGAVGRSCGTYKGSDLAGTVARHPMHHLGGFFAKPRPFLPGDFVTTDSGTGLVHMAPDHGEDDFLLCKEHGIEPVFAVEGDGKYREDWAWLGGQGSVINPKFNAPDGPICEADCAKPAPAGGQRRLQALLPALVAVQGQGDLPLHAAVVRADGQGRWCTFRPRPRPKRAGRTRAVRSIRHDEARCASPTLREAAMAAIADTRFVPEKGRNRIGSDGRRAARLGALPPARLGRADHAVRGPQDRPVPQRSRRQRPDRRRREGRRRRCVVR
jgi:hypothetical protein